MNKSILIGRWTKDTELKFLAGSGTAYLKGTLAVTRRVKKEGQPEADFIQVTVWGKQAESTAQYCGAKGNQIGITGRITTGSYDKDGTKVYTTEVTAEEVDFLTFKDKGKNENGNSGYDESTFGDEMTPVDDGDIPF